MIFSKRFFLSIFLFILTEACLAAPAGVDWQWVNPTPQGNPFNAVAYNSAVGASVAVGDRGNVVVSTDGGVNWAVQTSNTTQNLNAIYTDANTSFIAVGDNGTIVTETAAGAPPQLSGIWADFTDGSLTANLNGITKGNVTGSDLFVAVGDNGAVLTNDGSSNVWAVVSVPAGIGNLTAVVWSGTIFVAVSDNGTIIASPNGTSWTKENFTAGGSSAPNGFRAVTWSGSQLVAVGVAGLIETSTTGANWDERVSGTADTLTGIAWNGSQFVASASFGVVFSSTDGVSWSGATTFTTLSTLRAVIWGGGQFIVAGDGATLLTSSAGTSWTQRYPQAVSTQTIFNVIWSSTIAEFIASGNSNTLLTSPDGLVWTLQGSPSVFINMTDNGSLLVAAGSDGKPYTSADGVVWTAQTTSNVIVLHSIAWGGRSLSLLAVAAHF